MRVAREGGVFRAHGRTASRTALEPPVPAWHHAHMTTRFHHAWIVEVELELKGDGDCSERIFGALAAHGCDDTDPYPAQVTREDGAWLDVSFPIWAPTQWAAIAAGAATLADACTRAEAEVGVVRIGAAESSRGLESYRDRVRDMDTATS